MGYSYSVRPANVALRPQLFEVKNIAEDLMSAQNQRLALYTAEDPLSNPTFAKPNVDSSTIVN